MAMAAVVAALPCGLGTSARFNVTVATRPCRRIRAVARSLVDEKTDVWDSLEPVVLTSIMSVHNSIAILEVPRGSPTEFAGSRLLLLDETGNVHSVYREDTKWVGPYWDEFASLPPIIPEGPIAILGLGGGTAARLMLDLWPERLLVGWEIDQILIDKARMYLGLAEVEGINDHGGGLIVRVGDAFWDQEDPEGGFAGIIVDLFSDGEVLPALKMPETWFKLKKRLKPAGRIMINCVESEEQGQDVIDEHQVLKAMSQAFPGEVVWRNLDKVNNKMAFTGPLPDLERWSLSVPDRLRPGVFKWKYFHKLEVDAQFK